MSSSTESLAALIVSTVSSPQTVGDVGEKVIFAVGITLATTRVLTNDSQLPLKAVT